MGPVAPVERIVREAVGRDVNLTVNARSSVTLYLAEPGGASRPRVRRSLRLPRSIGAGLISHGDMV